MKQEVIFGIIFLILILFLPIGFYLIELVYVDNYIKWVIKNILLFDSLFLCISSIALILMLIYKNEDKYIMGQYW